MNTRVVLTIIIVKTSDAKAPELTRDTVHPHKASKKVFTVTRTPIVISRKACGARAEVSVSSKYPNSASRRF